MKLSKTFCLVVLVSLLGISVAKQWALIVAGASAYANYWSQSTACHAYHTVRNSGIPAENVILMSYDDIPTNRHNPVKNNLVVLPNGTNVYEGCNIDYRSHTVTPQVFLKVLQGDKTGVKRLLGREGPVIDSGPDDDIFVSMSDHGSYGAFYFPEYSPLHASDFNDALKSMHDKKRYKKMVIYMGSCHSGSMFEQYLPKDINIYVTTDADPQEPSYVCCYDDFRGVFVGTEYANGWQFDTDKANIKTRTLNDQFGAIKKSCARSHAQQYGDLSIGKEVIGEFQGNVTDATFGGHLDVTGATSSDQSNGHGWIDAQFHLDSEKLKFAGIDLIHPPMDMVDIATLARRIVQAEQRTQEDIAELKTELLQLMKIKEAAAEFVRRIASLVLGFQDVDAVMSEKQPLKNSVCYKAALDSLGSHCPGLNFGKYPFIRSNLRSIVNLCNMKPYRDVLEGIERAALKTDCQDV